MLRLPKLLVLLLLYLLVDACEADQLFVRNRPFNGVVQGAGAEMFVELEPLVTALGMSVQPSNGGWVVGAPPAAVAAGEVWVEGESVPVKMGPAGQPLVSLKDFARITRCKLNPNPSMKTVDLYLPPASTGAGSWGDNSSGSFQSAPSVPETAAPPEKATPSEVVGLFFQAAHRLPRLDSNNKAQMKGKMASFFRKSRPYLTREFYAQMTSKEKGQLEKAIEEDPSILEHPMFQMMLAQIVLYYEAMRTGTPQILKEEIQGKDAYVTFNVEVTDPISHVPGVMQMTAHLKKEAGRWKIAETFRF